MLYPTLQIPEKFDDIRSKTVDVRRYKDYARIITLTSHLTVKNDNRETVPWVRDHIVPLLREMLGAGTAVDSGFSVREHYEKPGQDWEGKPYPASLCIHITLRFKADKPRFILSEEDALEAIGGSEPLLSIVQEAVLKGQRESDSRFIRTQIRDEANQLVGQLARGILEHTDIAMRYPQRLAALQAERTAELEATRKTVLPKIVKEARAAWDDDEEWFQEVLRYAMTKLDTAVKHASGPSFFRSSNRSLFGLADIELNESFLPRRTQQEEVAQ